MFMAVLRGYVLYLVCSIRSKCKQYILHFQREVPSWRASADPAGGERELLVRKYREDGSPVRAILSGICPRRKVFANTVRVRTEKRIVPCRDAAGTNLFRTFAPMKIAGIDLGDKPLFLAPMEDVTDPSFRYVCKMFGADMVYTEFISCDGLIRDAAKTVAKLRLYDYERPVGIQLYGHQIEPMVEAARVAEAAGPDLIDINFGCPVRKIAGRGAGSGMMRDVPKMVEMTRRIVEAVRLPVTVKTRLGWDEDSRNIVEIAERLQDAGIAALTIHGRTRAQMYRGEADWTLIGEVKRNPRMRIPIVGNGDIDSGEKAAEAFERYGVDGVMIGRATYGRPWIFREIRQFLSTGVPMKQPSVRERVELAKLHLAKSLEFKGEKVGVLEMRRHLSCYFKGLPDFKATRLKLVTLTDPEQIVATLDEIARVWGDYDASEIVPKPLSHEV